MKFISSLFFLLIMSASIAMRFVGRRRMVVRAHAGRGFPAESRREDGGQQNQQNNASDTAERVHGAHYSERNCRLKTVSVKNSSGRAAHSTSWPYFLIG